MPAFAMVWQVASTILVWGRFYLRIRRLAGPFGYDDAFMLIAWVSSGFSTTHVTPLLTIAIHLDQLGCIHCLCMGHYYTLWSRSPHVGCSCNVVLWCCDGKLSHVIDRPRGEV